MEIKDYLHLYLGCKVEYDDRIGIIHQYYLPAGKYMEGKVWFCSLEEDGNPEMSCSVAADKVKPILRPLSDMTGEERSTAKELSNGTFLYRTCAETTQFLLSKHFDIFGLIESGLAIDKTKLNGK